MAVGERARHRLYNKAVEVLGEEEAAILMAHLPPGGWPNLATKQDVLELRHEITLRFQELEKRIVAELKSYTLRTVLVVNVSMVVAFAGIVFTAAGLS